MKLAGVQTDVKLGRIRDNLARIERWVEQAAGQGAELIVFPECAVTGYCFDSLDEAMEFGEPAAGPSTQSLTRICQNHQVHVVYGFLERDGDRLFNACACVGPAGLVGGYRKIHLPYLGVDRFTTPGDREFAVCDAGQATVGMHICYDASFPESARELALAGADVIVLPTNWPPGAETTAQHVPNARSLENKVFFIAVNRVGRERGFQFIGQSKICDVHGNTLAQAGASEETMIMADIDPSEARDKRIERVPGKHAIDRFKDRRPDMYRRLMS